MSLLDGKGPKTILGSIVRDLTGDGRKTNYREKIANEFGMSSKSKKRKQ